MVHPGSRSSLRQRQYPCLAHYVDGLTNPHRAEGVICEVCGASAVRLVRHDPAPVEVWRCDRCGDLKRWWYRDAASVPGRDPRAVSTGRRFSWRRCAMDGRSRTVSRWRTWERSGRPIRSRALPPRRSGSRSRVGSGCPPRPHRHGSVASVPAPRSPPRSGVGPDPPSDSGMAHAGARGAPRDRRALRPAELLLRAAPACPPRAPAWRGARGDPRPPRLAPRDREPEEHRSTREVIALAPPSPPVGDLPTPPRPRWRFLPPRPSGRTLQAFPPASDRRSPSPAADWGHVSARRTGAAPGDRRGLSR